MVCAPAGRSEAGAIGPAIEYVQILDVPVEVTMKSVIGCGSGSAKIIEAYADSARGSTG